MLIPAAKPARPLLNLAPKFVFILGVAKSQAVGGDPGDPGRRAARRTAARPEPVPAADPTPVRAAVARPVTRRRHRAGRQRWPAFPGAPWYLFVAGFGLAAATSYGLHRYLAVMFGAAGCDLGVANGIPSLRER